MYGFIASITTGKVKKKIAPTLVSELPAANKSTAAFEAATSNAVTPIFQTKV